ncbi:MAG: exodeoxyribonuclease III [Steroidobacteraceae bacterium]
MRIATWNVNSLRVRLPLLSEWLSRNPVDVLALQETKLIDADFPRAELEALGYQVEASGQKTYNGVALLSRWPLTAVVTDIPAFEDPARRVLAATTAGLRVVNLYVPNGQTVDSDKYHYKLRWLAALTAWLRGELGGPERLVVLGDFNIAPEDRDVHDPAAWAGSVHVSEPERRSLRGLLDLGLVDVFRRFEQPDRSYSWWDYRMLAFRRNHGLRIDLLLADSTLAAACTACVIDREPRRAERPSDHTPVIADFTTADESVTH